MFNVKIVSAVGLVLLTGSLFLACTKEQQQVVNDAVKLADKACVVLRHVGPDGIVQEICAYEEELSPLVPLVLTGRAHQKKDAGTAEVDASDAGLASGAEMDDCKAACSSVCK